MPELQYPVPLGYPAAAKDVQSVATPLLAAAALSLAGVVAGANTDIFGLPGPTLLILVVAALALIASIQLNYHARQFLYNREEIANWCTVDSSPQNAYYERFCHWQREDFNRWATFNNVAIRCFNLGTLLLGFGVSAALIPPSDARQGIWRYVAAVLVVVTVLADATWIYRLRTKNVEMRRVRSNELIGVMRKTEDAA